MEAIRLESPAERRKRKKEAKLLKRKRIEDAGGVRPRPRQSSSSGRQNDDVVSDVQQSTRRTNDHKTREKHRFGRVMESVPCRNKPRFSTLSIALPGSVIANCQTRELKTHLVGQIARAAAIYHVDEIVVFDDKLASERGGRGGHYQHRNNNKRARDHQGRRDRDQKGDDDKNEDNSSEEQQHKDAHENDESSFQRSDPHMFMARVLQYCECPQYMRRSQFPMHPDLQFSGLLPPLDAPHHVRAEDRSKYREGVVIHDKRGGSGMSLVNCGIRNRPVE
jgi:hypothetical protein